MAKAGFESPKIYCSLYFFLIDLMGLISLPLQFLFATPNIPLKYQTNPAVKFRPSELKNSGSLSILCCNGIVVFIFLIDLSYLDFDK